MPSLKEVRSRIATIKSTRQITSAMKMVSASKLRKAQNGILNLRPYAAHMEAMLGRLNAQMPAEAQSLYCKPNQGEKVLVISIASNKGLCGTYNTHLIKRTLDHLNSLKEENRPFELLLIGKKTEEFFVKREFTIYQSNHQALEHVNYQTATQLAAALLELYRENTFGRVDVVYNYFKNAIMQQLVVEQVLPVVTPADETLQQLKGPWPEDPFGHELEPSPREVMDTMVLKFFKTNIYRILLDASASEHGARMTAMHKATDNATELLKNLTLSYNKVRQSMITREIMEIVGGAEVLNQ
jgi:F-type H+-transporting ATPase subunit gamma